MRPRRTADTDELDCEIIDGLNSTANPAIGLAGGYDANTGDPCIPFRDTTAMQILPRSREVILSTPQRHYIPLYVLDEGHWGPYSTLIASILILRAPLNTFFFIHLKLSLNPINTVPCTRAADLT